jgi:hypothetical protein
VPAIAACERDFWYPAHFAVSFVAIAIAKEYES